MRQDSVQGKFCVEVDHDDELTPDCLQRIVEAFKQHPECGFAYGDCSEVYVEQPSRSLVWLGLWLWIQYILPGLDA